MSLSQSQMQEITGPVVAVGDGDEERIGDPVPVPPTDYDDDDGDPGSYSRSSAQQRPRRAAAEGVIFAGEEVSAQQLLLQAGAAADCVIPKDLMGDWSFKSCASPPVLAKELEKSRGGRRFSETHVHSHFYNEQTVFSPNLRDVSPTLIVKMSTEKGEKVPH